MIVWHLYNFVNFEDINLMDIEINILEPSVLIHKLLLLHIYIRSYASIGTIESRQLIPHDQLYQAERTNIS